MKTIDLLLIRLKEISGEPNLKLDYNSVYGGYRLDKVNPQTGATRGAFGESGCEPRMHNAQMCDKLRALINGIEYGLKNQKP